MLNFLIKLSELLFNLIDLIKAFFFPEKENKTQKNTFIIDSVNIIINPHNSSSNSSYQDSSFIVLPIIITIISAIVTTYFYNTISVILFFSTLLCTLLRFRVEKNYYLPEKAMKIFTTRGSLYSSFAISTFTQPIFVTNFYKQLPSAEGIFSHASSLISWLINSTKELFSYSQKEGGIIFFCLIMYLSIRIVLLFLLFSDIYCFLSKKALIKETVNILLNKKNQFTYLFFLIVIFFIACNPELIEKTLTPILTYLQS